ncbi:rRNA methyltransferase 1, mitochondrial [Antennarius striatus]|uniref:rRNA methyltransferase 1, mitochondrial n=1 Tax=Antennarius striatus TaxID=241820 RepID=UPI0035AF85D6
MCLSSILLQQKLLHVCSRRLTNHVPISSMGLLFASYHATTLLLFREDSSNDHVMPRRRKVSNTPGIRHKPVRKALENEMVQSQKPNPRREFDSRVSSELRKLSVEDFSPERKKPVKIATLNSAAENFEIVFGVAPCLLSLKQGRRKAYKLFVKDGEASHRPSILRTCEEAHRQGVQIQWVGKNVLDKMCSGRVHQGVCLKASPLNYLTENSKSTHSRKDNSTPLWLVLEGIQDPMNLGAILRSAYFLGVDRVASSLRSSCSLSPVVSKASSGVMEVFGVYGYENLESMLRLKAAQGWQVIGTVAAEAEESQIPVTNCSEFKITEPTLLLLGSEGEGLSKELLSLCQTLLTIPAGRDLFPGIESLNVSVATGILLHSLLFSRRSPKTQQP